MVIRIRVPLEDGKWYETYLPISDGQYTLVVEASLMNTEDGAPVDIIDKRALYVNRFRHPHIVIGNLK